MQKVMLAILAILIISLILYLENNSTNIEPFTDISIYEIKKSLSDMLNINIRRISEFSHSITGDNIDLAFSINPPDDSNERTTADVVSELDQLRKTKTQFNLSISDKIYKVQYSRPEDNINYAGLYVPPNFEQHIGQIYNLAVDGLVYEHNLDRTFNINKTNNGLLEPYPKM